MTLGLADRQGDLLDDVARFCDEVLPESSIYAVLYRERDRLFPDEMFADLFSDRGAGRCRHRCWRRGWCCSGWRACRTGTRWSGTRSMRGGGTRPGWVAMTARGGAGSRIRCWWTCGPG